MALIPSKGKAFLCQIKIGNISIPTMVAQDPTLNRSIICNVVCRQDTATVWTASQNIVHTFIIVILFTTNANSSKIGLFYLTFDMLYCRDYND